MEVSALPPPFTDGTPAVHYRGYTSMSTRYLCRQMYKPSFSAELSVAKNYVKAAQ